MGRGRIVRILSVFFFVSFFAFPKIAFGQVVINEFSSPTSSDWVELYAFEDVDISGWVLDDFGTDTEMKVIPGGVTVGPSTDTFYVVEVGNRLNKDGDIIQLINGDVVIDQLSYGDKGGVCKAEGEQTIGRYSDANSTIERFQSGTKGVSNNASVLDPCPTPTPTPTSTPTNTPSPTPTIRPTSTPTPTSTPKPVKTPTSTPTIKLKKNTPTPKSEDNENEKDELVLGLNEENEGTSTPAGEVNSEQNGVPALAGFFIVGGLGFISAASYPLLKVKLRGYNLKALYGRKENQK